jgi:glutamyl-tRNA reductase
VDAYSSTITSRCGIASIGRNLHSGAAFISQSLSLSPVGKYFRLAATTIEDSSKLASSSEKPKRKKGGDTPLEVVVLGLSHHNAPVEIREKLAIPEDNWNEASAALCEYPSISEATVLSTCNRFELYLAGPNQYECIRDAIDFLQRRSGGTIDQIALRKALFMLSGEDAIWHSLRVSAGLDSLVVGEGQILAQAKCSRKTYSKLFIVFNN